MQSRDRPGEKVLLLDKGDLHCIVLGDLKALQNITSSPCQHLIIVKLHEGDTMPPRFQGELLSARKVVEGHRQIELIGLLWQVGEEQDVIWWIHLERIGRKHLSFHKLL